MLGVFTWIGQYLYQALKYFFAGMEAIFGPVLSRLIPILFPVVFLVHWFVTWVIARINLVVGYLSAIHLPGTNLSGLTGLELTNTFFPLVEFFGLLFVYLTILATLNTYRLIKSWIPTLS